MWGDQVTGGCTQSSILPEVLAKIYADIKIAGGFYLTSPCLLWLVKLTAGAAGNRWNTSGATNPIVIVLCPTLKSVEH
jgi:hypothetical protein